MPIAARTKIVVQEWKAPDASPTCSSGQPEQVPLCIWEDVLQRHMDAAGGRAVQAGQGVEECGQELLIAANRGLELGGIDVPLTLASVWEVEDDGGEGLGGEMTEVPHVGPEVDLAPAPLDTSAGCELSGHAGSRGDNTASGAEEVADRGGKTEVPFPEEAHALSRVIRAVARDWAQRTTMMELLQGLQHQTARVGN